MVSETDGNLYDTRKPNWTAHPVREHYRGVRSTTIETTGELKAALRMGYAWPGGYDLVFYTSDGAILCTDCVRKHFRSVADSIRNSHKDGWNVVAVGYEAVSAECAKDAGVETNFCDQCAKEFGEIA